MASNGSRKARGRRTEKVLAMYYAERGFPWDPDAIGPTTVKRLTSRILVTNNDCWEYQGACASGYGRIFVGVKRLGTNRIERTHRLSWMLLHGPIEDDLVICHRCDNRPCCNPDHLFIGSRLDNMRDMDAKGRRVNTPHPGEKNGRAVLTEEQVRFIRSSTERGVDLAARFGVQKSTITAIRRGRLWKSVA